jgi:hypothetical protein
MTRMESSVVLGSIRKLFLLTIIHSSFLISLSCPS